MASLWYAFNPLIPNVSNTWIKTAFKSGILSRVIFFNNKHEFTQSWKTASDWSAVDERKWLFDSADIRGEGNAWRTPKDVCMGGYHRSRKVKLSDKKSFLFYGYSPRISQIPLLFLLGQIYFFTHHPVFKLLWYNVTIYPLESEQVWSCLCQYPRNSFSFTHPFLLHGRKGGCVLSGHQMCVCDSSTT